MLATDKQIDYLCSLADKVEKIKERRLGVTSIDASIRICAYKKLIRACNVTFILFGMKQV